MTAPAASSETAPEIRPDEGEAKQESLSEDQVFHVLQNERRRGVLKYLEGREGQVRMSDVAEQVSAWEHDTTVKQLSSTERQRVYIPLYQNHLPKLDKLGIIEYNQSRGIIETTDRTDELLPYLGPSESESAADVDADADANADEEFPWPASYMSISLFGSVLMLGKAWGLRAFGPIPGFVLAALILGLFTATTVLQLAVEQGELL